LKIPSKDDYEVGADLTFQVVGAYKVREPLFRFPQDVALIASIADIGDKLCVNTAARDLVAFLLAECQRRGLSDFPTAMMLRASLELHQMEVQWVPFGELGIGGSPFPTGRN
jgi:hypothetical protein